MVGPARCSFTLSTDPKANLRTAQRRLVSSCLVNRAWSRRLTSRLFFFEVRTVGDHDCDSHIAVLKVSHLVCFDLQVVRVPSGRTFPCGPRTARQWECCTLHPNSTEFCGGSNVEKSCAAGFGRACAAAGTGRTEYFAGVQAGRQDSLLRNVPKAYSGCCARSRSDVLPARRSTEEPAGIAKLLVDQPISSDFAAGL